MKKLILFLLLLPSLLFAQDWQEARMSIGIVGGQTPTGSLNTVDVSRGFEVDSDPSGWTETDTGSILNRYDTADKHYGTHSMSIAAAGVTTAAYYTYDIGSSKNNVSLCMWFKPPTSSSGDDAFPIISFGTFSGGFPGTYSIKIRFKKSAGSYHFVVDGATISSNSTAVTPGQWMRIEVKAQKNTTSTLNVYDASGSPLISELSVNANDQTSRYVDIGINTRAQTGWGTFYYDDVGMDWTDATSPLWEYTVEN